MSMGKYSLDSYERVPTVRFRPAESLQPARDAEAFTFRTAAAEPGKPLPEIADRTLMEVRMPAFAPEDAAAAESALRELASRCCRDPRVIGVTLRCGADGALLRRMWEAAAEAFAPKRFFVPVTDGAQLDYALRRGFLGGLLVPIGDHVYDTCEAFARSGAQELYLRVPVLVRGEGKADGTARYAEQWHAAAVENLPGARAGWRIALRRLTCPPVMSSGGFAPLRFWWTNRGPSLCHGKTEVRLRIVNGNVSFPIPLNDRPDLIPLGDRVHNEIARLPDAPPGVYRLEYGLFFRDGGPLTLCNEGQTADGFCAAGEITLDGQPRPEYEHAWDDYFPDGYYPLEDPKTPGT